MLYRYNTVLWSKLPTLWNSVWQSANANTGKHNICKKAAGEAEIKDNKKISLSCMVTNDGVYSSVGNMHSIMYLHRKFPLLHNMCFRWGPHWACRRALATVVSHDASLNAVWGRWERMAAELKQLVGISQAGPKSMRSIMRSLCC